MLKNKYLTAICAFILISCTQKTEDMSSGDDTPGTNETISAQYAVASANSVFAYTSVYSSASRNVGFKVYYPTDFSGKSNLILVSHGGFGAAAGENLLDHLGNYFASIGFVAAHIGHRTTPGCLVSNPTNPECYAHYGDRTEDVSQVIDRFSAGLVTMTGFTGTLDTRFHPDIDIFGSRRN